MATKQLHRRRFHLEYASVIFVVACLAVLLELVLRPEFLSRYLYDRMLNELPAPVDTEVVVVAIDESSLRELGRWPWDRQVHADLIDRLREQGVRAILFDVLFAEPDLENPEGDLRLAQAMKDHGGVYLPVHVEQLRTGGQLVEVMPHNVFVEAAKGLGHVDLDVDSDGVVRRVYLRSGIGQAFWPHITLTMLSDQEYRHLTPFLEPATSKRGSFANVREHPHLIPYAGPPGTYPQLSAVDVIQERVPPQLLRDHIVMIGATAAGLGDLLSSPMSAEGVLMPGVEINASIFDGLMNERLITPIDGPSRVLIIVCLSIIAPLMLPFIMPRWSIPVLALLLLAQVMLSYVLLRWFQVWLPLGAPLIATVASYPIWTWRRLEYTLGYLRAALGRLSEYSELNKRLSEPANFDALKRMLEDVLPVTAWRLDEHDLGRVKFGGDVVPESAWQGVLARHYTFHQEGRLLELSIIWQADVDADSYRGWVEAMMSRVSSNVSLGSAAHEVVEGYIDRVREEEMRQQALTGFFNSSLQQLQDGVVICDSCGGTLYANDRALQWLGVPQGKYSSYHFLDMVHELILPRGHDDWSKLLVEALSGELVELECQTRDKTDIYLGLVQLDTAEKPGKVLVLTLRDISVVKQALRTRSEMLDFLSHDLRSPMVSVLALTERMRQQPLDKDFIQFLDSVDHHARRNLSISEQFLQLARVESLETLELTATDMLAVVEDAIEDVDAQAQSKEIKLSFNYDASEEVWVMGNHELLQRLLVNLLTNAIKYSSQTSVVDIRLFGDDEHIFCEVRDHGVGIAPEHIDRIFEQFSRLKETSQQRGAGLGLRFVKVVASRHGGEVRVSSEVGHGSCFTLSLPRWVDDIQQDGIDA